MTLIVGFNLQNYVIIGADSRVCYFPRSGLRFRDDEEKIRRTALGLVTGAGLCELLDPVKERFQAEKPSNTDEMSRIIHEQCALTALKFRGYPDIRVQESLTTTGWMLTYITNSELYCPAGLRLAVMSASMPPGRFGLALPGKYTFLPFSGIAQQQYDELSALVDTAGLEEWDADRSSFTDNLVRHVGIIAKVILRASEMSEMVSPMFQIGVHTIFHQRGISKLIDPTTTFSFELRLTDGDAD